jgi:hypothetical protein
VRVEHYEQVGEYKAITRVTRLTVKKNSSEVVWANLKTSTVTAKVKY